MRKTKIHIGKNITEQRLPVCDECQCETDDLWECNTCGKHFCEDHIVSDGNDTDDIRYICLNCKEERLEK